MLARELVLPHLLADRAAECPDRTFLEEVDGRSISYGDLHRYTLTWADAYRRLGITAGDRVAVMLPTGIDAVSAWLGLSWLRAWEVPVNTGYVGRMLHYLLEHSRSKLLVTAADYLERLGDVAEGTHAPGDGHRPRPERRDERSAVPGDREERLPGRRSARHRPRRPRPRRHRHGHVHVRDDRPLQGRDGAVGAAPRHRVHQHLHG